MSINESEMAPAQAAVEPPLGLISRRVATDLRIRDIVAAMYRYELAGEPIPREWQDELDELTLSTPASEPAPEPGEVADLVVDLKLAAARYFNHGFSTDARRCRRAALAAEPVGDGPSEEELRHMWQFNFSKTNYFRFCDIARMALARWGRPVAPPAPETPAEALAARPVAAMEICHGHQDGECHWEQCPQLRDSEPAATGRSCPLPLDPVDIERAALARWGHPAAPPVPDAGEVAS